ncbi:mechanosensitive ion channel [Desulfobaculum bizertense]|uniref:mechanosensitive ion channel family protein n=1 Tax=Desulfobaculum bizertense TaxID=376490 RepID=UPI001F48F15D|nr:mechanosensitive ion channel domain-containing protein [Desulfobaculum bizertense]UIJ38595.1 mechanosensitive ion channel [Desulfobaculum bizertense]
MWEEILRQLNVSQWVASIMGWVSVNSLRIPVALVFFLVGRWVAKRLANMVRHMVMRHRSDGLLANFLAGCTYYALLTAIIISALGQLGLNVTSLVAILGAAGLAVGLALKNSLSNFAAGAMLVLFHPFKVGDYIEGAGTSGTVQKLNIFQTILTTPDNKMVFVPNGKLLDSVIVNVTHNTTRRLDMVVGVSYDTNLSKTKEILLSVLEADDAVLKDPAPNVAVHELADSSVNLIVRPWVNTSDYWATHWRLKEGLKNALDDAGISIPFPQQDVHVHGLSLGEKEGRPLDEAKPENA